MGFAMLDAAFGEHTSWYLIASVIAGITTECLLPGTFIRASVEETEAHEAEAARQMNQVD